jgi:hypothetical protein
MAVKSVDYYYLVNRGRIIFKFMHNSYGVIDELFDKNQAWYFNVQLANIQRTLKEKIASRIQMKRVYTWEELQTTFFFGEAYTRLETKKLEVLSGGIIVYTELENETDWNKDNNNKFILSKISGSVIDAVLTPEFRPIDFKDTERFILPKIIHDANPIKNINIVNDFAFYHNADKIDAFLSVQKKLKYGEFYDVEKPAM